LVFNGTFSTNRLYRAIGVGNISRRARRQHRYRHIIKQWNNTINQSKTLFSLVFLETTPSPWLGFIEGVFLANHWITCIVLMCR